MPGFWSKFKQVAGIATPVIGAVVPGARPVTEIVERVISDRDDPQNIEALRHLAVRIDRIEKQFAKAGIRLE